MRILFNTNYSSAATVIGMDQLSVMFENAGHAVTRNDWSGYENYDVVFFASPDSRVLDAKKANPHILACIVDPKVPRLKLSLLNEVRAADFLMVSSIEHRDFLLRYNKHSFIFYFFPDTPKELKRHTDHNPIVLGYHGNKLHLEAMQDVSWALDELSERYDITLHAIYNVEGLGSWKKNRPKRCKVIDIQWTPRMAEGLKKCDIGIVPSLNPPNFLTKLFLKQHEYFFRFKYSNGPGRIYPFAMLGIPVVADATPSQGQFIQNGVSGFVCCTKEGWYDAIERLIVSSALRNEVSEELFRFIERRCSIERIFDGLLEFISALQKKYE